MSCRAFKSHTWYMKIISEDTHMHPSMSDVCPSQLCKISTKLLPLSRHFTWICTWGLIVIIILQARLFREQVLFRLHGGPAHQGRVEVGGRGIFGGRPLGLLRSFEQEKMSQTCRISCKSLLFAGFLTTRKNMISLCLTQPTNQPTYQLSFTCH